MAGIEYFSGKLKLTLNIEVKEYLLSNKVVRRMCVIIVIFFLSYTGKSQIIDDKTAKEPIDIDEIIKLKESDKQQQTILISFNNNYSADDRITVEEFQNYYEIIVVHPAADGYAGGAEAYKVNKKTGESEMIWHEHPMKLPEIEIQEEKGKKRKKNN